MNRTMRNLSRVAGLALVLSGAALVVAGEASANDRAVVVSCTDHTAGTWEVSVTFSSVEVKVDRPVVVTLGSHSVTLTEPGPNGTVTLRETFAAALKSADVRWSVVRQDYQNVGILHLAQPTGCIEVQSAPPASEATPTPFAAPPAAEAPPASTPAPPSPATNPPQVLAAHVQALPVTGGPTVPLLVLGIGTVLGGLVLVRTGRRRAEQAEV